MSTPAVDPRRMSHLEECTLVVVKVGSGVLTQAGGLNADAVRRLGREIASVRRTGRLVALVSSGAVACGLRVLGLSTMPRAIVDKQAAAAVGQQLLVAAWASALKRYRIPVAQVLLTAEDLDHRRRYLNARHTLQALLRQGVLPVINENDSVSFDEIRMGDNDHLSALVTTLVAADLLVLLTNVQGLHRGGPNGPVIDFVAAGADVATHVAQGKKSATGVGGMQTKLEAATLVGDSGIAAVSAGGSHDGVLSDVLASRSVGTFFEPRRRALDPRRRWLATATRPRGSIHVDAGACRAIVERKASLLPAGVITVEGRFDAGAVVRICEANGASFARGLVSYPSDEIARIKGCSSREILGLLGYFYQGEIVHRNDLVLDQRVRE